MLIIKIKDGETIDRALRRYKKKFEKTGVLKEVRSRMYYEKPSEENREILKRARRRQEHYAAENF
jgi:small subunit ribosomal protein S21